MKSLHTHVAEFCYSSIVLGGRSNVRFFRCQLAVSLALLTLAGVTGCKPPTPGQAFIVVKSGDVQPLADMEVVFLPESFKPALASLQVTYQLQQSLSLSNLLTKNLEASNTVATMNAKIGRIQADIQTAGKPDPSQQEVSLKKVEAAIAEERTRVAAQLEVQKQLLKEAEVELGSLAKSAKSRFDAERQKKRQEMGAQKQGLGELEKLVAEFDTAVAELSREIQEQTTANEKAKRRREQIPPLVAKMLNTAIREQRLETPLLNELVYQIRTESDYFPLGSRRATYIKTTSRLENIREELQVILSIPVELEAAKTLPDAMKLVRERLDLNEQQSTGERRLRELRVQREKAATPWVNLNSDKVTQLRRELSLSVFGGDSSSKRRFSFDSDVSEAWPPQPYQSAKDAIGSIQSQLKKKEEELAKQTFDDFAAELTRQAKATLEGVQATLRGLTEEISTVAASKAERIQAETATVAARAREVISGMEAQLKAVRGVREKYVAEIDEENQRKLLRGHRSAVIKLIGSSTQSTGQTDRNGDFLVPGSAAFVWASKSRDNGEKFYWLRRVQHDATGKMLLSNSTISSREDYDWLVDYALK